MRLKYARFESCRSVENLIFMVEKVKLSHKVALIGSYKRVSPQEGIGASCGLPQSQKYGSKVAQASSRLDCIWLQRHYLTPPRGQNCIVFTPDILYKHPSIHPWGGWFGGVTT